jgi:hypothetical protein
MAKVPCSASIPEVRATQGVYEGGALWDVYSFYFFVRQVVCVCVRA